MRHLILTSLLALAPAIQAEDAKQLLNLHGVPKAERTLLPIAVTWPEKPGEAALCLWHDDKLAVLSITIDDNVAKNIDWWLRETAKRDLKVTWFLVAGGIGNTNVVMNGTWDDWKKVRAAGHGLESHTVSHLSGSRNLETWKGIAWEYAESRTLIEAGLGDGHRVTSLAYPGGTYPGKNDPEVAAKHFAAGRTGRGSLNGPQGLDYMNINAMSKSNFGEMPQNAFSNADNLLDPENKPSYRGWCVVLRHYFNESDPEIVKTISLGLDWAVKHREQVWTARFGDAARYGQERETSKLAVTANEPARIVISLTDRMDDRIFDFPLTVKVRLPDAWKGATATQKDAPANVRIVEREGARFALVGIVPDHGDTVLVPVP